MTKLDQAINALRTLPTDEQDQFADELLLELSLRSQTGLTAEQRETVADRLKQPFEFASPDSVSALYQKY